MTPPLQQLYAAAHAPERRAELELAAGAWFQGEARPEVWADFIDFFVLEWVGRDGRTLLEETLGQPLTAACRRWLTGLRSGLFVVDRCEGELTWCRDAATEEVLAVAVGEVLAPKTLIRGRLLPDEAGHYQLTGDPDIYDALGVIDRLELVRAWEQSPRRRLSLEQAALRTGFVRQRDQRDAFVAFFGADELLFATGRELEEHLNGFLDHLLFRYRPAGLLGRTFASHHELTTSVSALHVGVELGPSLREGGEVGVIFDDLEGVHLLPDLGAFAAHLQGREHHPEVVRGYLEDPGVTALPFRRVGHGEKLAELLGVPEAPLDDLLAPFKDVASRRPPSPLPGFDG